MHDPDELPKVGPGSAAQAAIARKVALPADKHLWRPSPLPGQVVLITTVDAEGRPGVATKSWISMVAFGPPPVLMFGCNLDHATARNALASGEFVVNMPGDDLVEASWAVGSDARTLGSERFERNGLTPIPAVRVRPPRIAECRAHLECEVDGIREWGREVAVFGRVAAVSVDRAETADAIERYRALAPFFFLEGGLAAPLGVPRRAGGTAGEPAHPEPADGAAEAILALECAALDRWGQGVRRGQRPRKAPLAGSFESRPRAPIARGRRNSAGAFENLSYRMARRALTRS